MDKFSETRVIPNGEPPKRKPGRPRIHPVPAEAAKAPTKGIVCPSCGSPINYVHRSVQVDGRRKRQRVCQSCKRMWDTWEG